MIQKVLISKKIFDSFNKFELEDTSWMNEYDRHYEHSEIYESTLHERGAINVECMEEYLDNTQDMENLHMAIKNLPEVSTEFADRGIYVPIKR